MSQPKDDSVMATALRVIEGAALTTVASNALGALYFATTIAKSKVHSLRPSDICLSRHQLAEIAKVGSSAMLMGLLQACEKGLAANVLSMVKGFALVACILVGSLLFAADGVIASLLVAEALAFFVAVGLTALSFGRALEKSSAKEIAIGCK